MLTFFLFCICNRGWLRADSLEELVGLDVSYHGRSTHGENGDIKKEYIEAYNRYKGTIRPPGSHGGNNSNPDRHKLPFSSGDSLGRSSVGSTATPTYIQHYSNVISKNNMESDKQTESTATESRPDKEESKIEEPSIPEESSP